MSALIHTIPTYAGRHRPQDTQPIALPPVSPQYGRLSRPLRPVPTPDATVAMPALRLLPPVQVDRRAEWKLTRRGQVVAVLVGGAALVPALYGFWAVVGFIGSLVGAA